MFSGLNAGRWRRLRLLVFCLTIIAGLGAGRATIHAVAAGQGSTIAEDPLSHHIYLAQPGANAVFVMAGRDMGLLTVLQVAPSPSAIAIDPKRHRVYIASDPAGVIAVYDDRTFRHIWSFAVGGHPAGLTLIDAGRHLLVADGASGVIHTLAALDPSAEPADVFWAGNASKPFAIAAPPTVPRNQPFLVWARGFTPGERVTISWGVTRIGESTANGDGVVRAMVPVPGGADLGRNLVVLTGEQSTVSASAIVSTLPALPVVHRRPRIVKPARPSVPIVQRLLAISVTVTLPAHLLPQAHPKPVKAPAHHGSSTPPHAAVQGSAPAGEHGSTVYVPLIALAPVPLVLLAYRFATRKRRAEKKAARADGKKGNGKGKKPRKSGAIVKKAA